MEVIAERLASIDAAAREILRRYDSGDMRLTSSPYAHACWDAQFDGRLPWSSGVVTVDRQFIIVGHGHGDRAFRRRMRREAGKHVELWIEAARAVCGVRKGQARYFIRRYPREVAAIIRHLYPENRGAVCFIATPPKQ